MAQNLQRTKNLIAETLRAMTDDELDAVIGPNPRDLSDFTDQELDAIINDCASPELVARVEAAPRRQSSKETS